MVGSHDMYPPDKCTVCGGRGRRPSGAGDSDPCHACAGTGARNVEIAQTIFDEGWAAAMAQVKDNTRQSDPPAMTRGLLELAKQLVR